MALDYVDWFVKLTIVLERFLGCAFPFVNLDVEVGRGSPAESCADHGLLNAHGAGVESKRLGSGVRRRFVNS